MPVIGSCSKPVLAVQEFFLLSFPFIEFSSKIVRLAGSKNFPLLSIFGNNPEAGYPMMYPFLHPMSWIFVEPVLRRSHRPVEKPR
jgi:hypothetical protein